MALQKSGCKTLHRGVNAAVGKIAFSAEIAAYLGNGTI